MSEIDRDALADATTAGWKISKVPKRPSPSLEDEAAAFARARKAVETATRTDPREVEIPHQIRRGDLAFILVPPSKKGAKETAWESEANYPHDHTTLTIHRQRGGNYGLFPRAGSSLVILDADDLGRLHELGALDGFPDTFTVESGSSSPAHRKAHLYYLIEGAPLVGKRIFLDPETGEHIGDVFAQHPDAGKGYVVGPGSLHPSGERYKVALDAPIASLPRATWDGFAAAVRWKEERPAATPARASSASRGGSFGDAIGISVTDVWNPPADATRTGDEVRFGHPVHGSTTGTNLSINTRLDTWHCFRCDSGGDGLLALAVQEGIIDCADARRDALADATLMERVKDAARARGYKVDEIEQERRATRRRTYTPAEREAAGTAPTTTGPKPAIQVNDRQLREVTADALTAMVTANRPPRVFVRAGALTRIGRDEDGRPMIQAMNEHQVRHELARSADFQKHTIQPARDQFGRIERDAAGKVKLEAKVTSVPPPIDVVRDLMADPAVSRIFPPLRAIIEAPSIRPDGGLIIAAGYDEVTGLYLVPSPGLVVPEIPETPTPDQVTEAADLLLEVIHDFPFVVTERSKAGEVVTVDASKANAIAALMTPVLRPFITGPIPLGLLDKPQQGTGASLLAEVVALIATGTSASMSDPPKREEEWTKSILSDLLAGRVVIVYDNLEGRLRASALASALTAEYVNGRILGRSETVSVPQRAVWLATGINIQLAGDLPRRCYWVRMDAQSSKPWLREVEFKHPQLKEWTRENRGRIIAAILTLARAWLRGGEKVPKSVPILGSFEAWSETIGGILTGAGIDGFLGNLDQQYEEADADGPALAAFLEEWFGTWGGDSKTVAELAKQLQTDAAAEHPERTLYGVLPDELLDAFANREKFNRRMGDAFKRRKGMRFEGGYHLEKAGTVDRAVRWIVVKDEPKREEPRS